MADTVQNSEDRYYKMIDEVQDYAIILLDVNGIVQKWNKGAQQIKLYTADEIIGKHFSAFYLPEDREAGLPQKLLNKAKTEGRAIHEGWRLRKDGTRFWGSIAITAVHDNEENVIGYTKVTKDLTEKKLADEKILKTTEELRTSMEALRISEERYHKMVEEVQDYAIILLDKDGLIQNWNKGAQKIKQYAEADVLGKHFSLFYLPEDRQGKLPEILLNQASQYGRAIHEGWRMRKDRTRFWGSITLTALYNDNHELIGFSKVTRDLTEKKLAEDQLKNFASELQISNSQLKKSEERYHKMIGEVQDYAIILLDVNGNIQNWNMGAQKIKGYTEEEIIGRNFRVFYTDEDVQRGLPDQLLREATEKGRAVHEGWRVTKQGKRFWGSIVITALHDDDGSIIGYSKVTRDLTLNKEAEDKQTQYLHELQRQNEELDRFAYTASHDLQEPLRKIQMFADLIGENLEDISTARKYLEKINNSSGRMSELISSILDYSRLTRSTTEKVDTDLNTIFANITGDFELLIQQKHAVIGADHLPVIKAVPLQVNQLFANLIGNALKYTREKPTIHVFYSVISGRDARCNTEPDRNYHQLIFTDNGIGFEQTYADTIFTLFHRLHGKHQFGGTGIGLALCKKIMEHHGGYICAEGKPGQGASFYVYFPVESPSLATPGKYL